jgi:ADP-ribosylglycohydrolase
MSADNSKTSAAPIRTWPKPPLPNTYWVEPGRLLAGEYPGAGSLVETTSRLQKLLAAGVTLFVDLTAEGELNAYHTLFEYAQGENAIKHSRHYIKDHDVPKSPKIMQEILDTIDAHLANNGVAYVHCRAGIGRTGTTVGCYLVRSGLGADAALDRLNDLWCESERSRTWPSVPETEEQIEFIRGWSTTDPKINSERAQSSAKFDSYAGAILGMAVGDALGALVPDVAVDANVSVSGDARVTGGSVALVSDLLAGGPHSVPRGAWLADTAMCWCLAESLLTCNGVNPEDQMQRYLAWQREGKNASTHAALNVPTEVGKALAQWQWTRKPIAGSHDPDNRDAHALARTLAPVLYFAADPARALVEAGESARTTLQSPVVLDASRAFSVLLLDALSKLDKDAMLSMKRSSNSERLRRNRLKQPVTQLMDGWWRGPAPPARSGRDVLAVLSTAVWAFDQTDNFRDGVLLAVNSCANSASSGAVFGALAGAHYGLQSIPKEWRSGVLQADGLLDVAQRLADR